MALRSSPWTRSRFLTQRWLDLHWTNRYTGDTFPIAGKGHPSAERVRIKTYRAVHVHHRVHPEPKSLDVSGEACGRASVGLLARRPVTAAKVAYIGKESNKIEEGEGGLVHNIGERLNSYGDQDAWPLVCRVLRDLPATQVADPADVHRRTVERLLTGATRPHQRTRERLLAVADSFARHRLFVGEGRLRAS